MNLQLDHFSDDFKNLQNKTPRAKRDSSLLLLLTKKQQPNNFFLPLECDLTNHASSRPQQRVAMDDLASYFVEERSKVR